MANKTIQDIEDDFNRIGQAEKVPIDQPSNNPNVDAQRKQIKADHFQIDKFDSPDTRVPKAGTPDEFIG
jgi:hypothetical protein